MRDADGTIVGASRILRDVTESRRAREALRESEQRLASEAAAARTLQSIGTRLISESTQESLFAQILDAAMELMASDAGQHCRCSPPDGESSDAPRLEETSTRTRLLFWQRVTADAGGLVAWRSATTCA